MAVPGVGGTREITVCGGEWAESGQSGARLALVKPLVNSSGYRILDLKDSSRKGSSPCLIVLATRSSRVF